MFYRFPPEVWASEPDNDPSTTNSFEAFHADFNGQFGSAHPNVHARVQVLEETQCQTYVKMHTIEVGEVNRRTPKVVRRVDRKMKAWAEVREGKRDISSYLKLVGFMTKARSKQDKETR